VVVENSDTPGGARWVHYAPMSKDESNDVVVKVPSPRSRPIVLHCLTTGERCTIEIGPTPEDFAAGSWTYDCPSCGEAHEQSYRVPKDYDPNVRTRTNDIPLDMDLGELIAGQHVVLRGIELRTTSGSVLHNDFVPGFPRDRKGLEVSWGLGEVHDDLGTVYDHQGQGGWGAHPDGIVHWGDEDLGNGIPAAASTLTIEVHHANDWNPRQAWIEEVSVDLASGEVSIVRNGSTAWRWPTFRRYLFSLSLELRRRTHAISVWTKQVARRPS
jgi:hypothetical protein